MEKIINFIKEYSNVLNTVTDLAGDTFGPWIKGIVILIFGWAVSKFLVARLVRTSLNKLLSDSKLENSLGIDGKEISKNIAKIVYLISMLFVALACADMVNLGDSVTKPITGMLESVANFIPGAIGAAVILALGIFGATLVKNILVNFLSLVNLDEKLGIVKSEVNERLGMDNFGDSKSMPITNSIANTVYFFIILNILPFVAKKLGIKTIEENVSNFTSKIWNVFPNIVLAVILLVIGVIIANIVKNILLNVLPTIGFDSLPAKLGLNVEFEEGKSPSGVVALVSTITIIILFLSEALNKLDLGVLSSYADKLVPGYFGLLGGIVISFIGIMVANFVYDVLVPKNQIWAKIAKTIILLFAAAMALQVADISPISSEVFGNLLNGVVIAFCVVLAIGGAIAVGLGGRFAVAKYLDNKIK